MYLDNKVLKENKDFRVSIHGDEITFFNFISEDADLKIDYVDALTLEFIEQASLVYDSEKH